MIPKELIERLNLKRHPEGGMYCETYRSQETKVFSQAKYEGHERSLSTLIYFALSSEDFSAFHKINYSDEIWLHHEGSNLKIMIIDENGDLQEHILGDFRSNKLAKPQVTVKGNSWFAAAV